jgi:hypothetical protein
LIWSLIPRVAVIWIKSKSFWACVCPICEWCFREVQTYRGIRYNNWLIFRTKHTLRSSLMKTWPEIYPQQTAQCIYSIPCECGRSPSQPFYLRGNLEIIFKSQVTST